jgi:membrane protease YdiL (CAAX protease family)
MVYTLGMYPLFVFGSLGLTVGLAWATYQSGRLLRAVPVRENLLLAPVENMVKGALVLICVGLGVLSGAAPGRLGWTLDNGWRDLGLGIILGLATQVAANSITSLAIKVWGKQIYSPVVMKNIMPRTRPEWLLVPAALGLAVLLEELLFRSLLIGGLSLTVPLPLLLVGFSAIFGLMHSPQGPLGVVLTGVLGLWLSLLFVWSGGLILPLTAHYVINFLQLLKAQDERAWLDSY